MRPPPTPSDLELAMDSSETLFSPSLSPSLSIYISPLLLPFSVCSCADESCGIVHRWLAIRVVRQCAAHTDVASMLRRSHLHRLLFPLPRRDELKAAVTLSFRTDYEVITVSPPPSSTAHSHAPKAALKRVGPPCSSASFSPASCLLPDTRETAAHPAYTWASRRQYPCR